jgi:hypothetical protein
MPLHFRVLGSKRGAEYLGNRAAGLHHIENVFRFEEMVGCEQPHIERHKHIEHLFHIDEEINA